MSTGSPSLYCDRERDLRLDTVPPVTHEGEQSLLRVSRSGSSRAAGTIVWATARHTRLVLLTATVFFGHQTVKPSLLLVASS